MIKKIITLSIFLKCRPLRFPINRVLIIFQLLLTLSTHLGTKAFKRVVLDLSQCPFLPLLECDMLDRIFKYSKRKYHILKTSIETSVTKYGIFLESNLEA